MSLKWKSALLIFCASLALIPASVEYLLRVESTTLTQQQQSSHQKLLKKLVIIASEAMTNRNDDAETGLVLLQQRFNHYVELPQYQGFYLYQNNKIIVAHADELVLPKNIQNSPYQQRLTIDGEIFLLMILSTKVTLPEMLIFAGSAWFIILLVVFTLTALGYLMGNRLAIKIDELIVGISKAGGGNFSQRIMESSSDELSQLVISYNRMLDNLLLVNQESKEQLQSYKNILDSAAEGIVSLNDRGVIQEYNQSAIQIFGYSAEEIIGKNISKLIPTKIKKTNGDTIEQDFLAYDEETIKSCEVIGVRKDEQHFPIDLSVSVSIINNSRVFTGIIRDISKRLQSEKAQKVLEMQLTTLQRHQTIESLTGGIAHDFNNILGPVLGYADMALSDAEEGTKQHKYLSYILKGAHRARELVARIMRFTRQYEMPTEQFHLTSVIDEAVALLKASIPSEHQIETFYNFTNDSVTAEKTQLTQVLVTMLTNASQALEGESGTLTVRLDNVVADEQLLARSGKIHAGNYVRIRVQDTGKGMDVVMQKNIFEPFFSTKDQSSSTGLGLSVANGIINNFGGAILVESEVGKGSTFSVFLPVIESDDEHDIPVILKPISKNGELILYIDDDEVIAELGKEMLESLGYEVEVSVDSVKALQMFRNDPEDYDLVITDQSMPVLKGTQLARELKKIRSDIPIILVTGFSAGILNQELVDSGIDHCIAKPVVIDELGEIVLQALAKFNQE